MIRCFYHSMDLDGHMSGSIVKHYFEKEGREIKMYPIDYGDKFPWDEISKEDNVYLVDFTLQPYEDTLKLAKLCKLTLIDHHKSAVEALEDKGLTGILRSGEAGCELTWKFFYPNKEIPEFVRLLGRYDVFDKSNLEEWNDTILPFQYGMRLQDTDPRSDNNVLKVFLDGGFVAAPYINDGDTVLKYQDKMNANALESFGYDVEFEGYKAIALNTVSRSFQTFASKWDKNKYDMVIVYEHVRGEHYTVSMYTDKEGISCLEAGKKWGAKGHVQACGFQCKELPWLNDK